MFHQLFKSQKQQNGKQKRDSFADGESGLVKYRVWRNLSRKGEPYYRFSLSRQRMKQGNSYSPLDLRDLIVVVGELALRFAKNPELSSDMRIRMLKIAEVTTTLQVRLQPPERATNGAAASMGVNRPGDANGRHSESDQE